ncbi:MAG TPA: DUF4124 domain-containing protein [Thioalkalivibrio sp.]|nr:DUF4124 domain-containing protein [Thioalkalivibrio sp.]
MKHMTGLLTALCLCLVTVPTVAAMYKWADDEGNTQYSQTPPMDRPSETLNAPKAPPAPPPAAETAAPDTAGETAAEDAAGPSAAERRRAERQNAARCQEARAVLQRYETTPRIRVPDGDSFRYLSEEERQKHMRDARQIIREHCQ